MAITKLLFRCRVLALLVRDLQNPPWYTIFFALVLSGIPRHPASTARLPRNRRSAISTPRSSRLFAWSREESKIRAVCLVRVRSRPRIRTRRLVSATWSVLCLTRLPRSVPTSLLVIVDVASPGVIHRSRIPVLDLLSRMNLSIRRTRPEGPNRVVAVPLSLGHHHLRSNRRASGLWSLRLSKSVVLWRGCIVARRIRLTISISLIVSRVIAVLGVTLSIDLVRATSPRPIDAHRPRKRIACGKTC